MTNTEFEKILHQYERFVFTICHQIVQDYHDAQNLTQETFLSAYTHIDGCSSEKLKPWLARIAVNKAKDHLKNAYHQRVLLDREPDSGESLLDTGQSPDDIFKVTETHSALESIYNRIDSLSEPYRKVSALYFIEEKNTDEIASLLDRPKRTVQTQIYRARQLLQNLLKGDTHL